MPGKTVLVVDDDAYVVRAFQSSLHREPYDVIGVRGVREALEQIDTGRVDVVITDIRLPGRSGLSLLAQLVRSRRHVPVIVVTGYSDWVSEKDLRLLGASEVFFKPLDLSRIRTAIRRLLDPGRGPDQTDSTSEGGRAV